MSNIELTREEQKVLQQKHAKRLELRKEYIKQINNPYKHASGEGGTLFDTGMQRFQAMRVSNFEHFKPTPKSFGMGMAVVVLPIVGYCYFLKYERDRREAAVRTGQVSYRDRKFKFI